MAKRMSAVGALAALALLLLAAVAADDDRIADLVSRRAAAADGVVKLDDASVRHLAASSGRPYDLLVFFDAIQLRERSPELKLETLRSDFGLVAQAYQRSNSEGSEGNTKLFFCVLEFENAQQSFASFGVKALPHVRYVPAGSSPLSAAEGLEMNYLSAEGMQAFLQSRTKFGVGEIRRPPLFSTQQLIFMAVAAAVTAPFVIRKLVATAALRDPKLWCTGALVIYFFSVSGGMFNIIRKMPLFMSDRNDPKKLVFFYQGSGMQLGTEGFAVGSLYTTFGLLLAFITQLLPSIKSRTTQRLVMVVALFVCFWTVKKVVSLDNWKTGYSVHHYIPKSWR